MRHGSLPTDRATADVLVRAGRSWGSIARQSHGRRRHPLRRRPLALGRIGLALGRILTLGRIGRRHAGGRRRAEVLVRGRLCRRRRCPIRHRRWWWRAVWVDAWLWRSVSAKPCRHPRRRAVAAISAVNGRVRCGRLARRRSIVSWRAAAHRHLVGGRLVERRARRRRLPVLRRVRGRRRVGIWRVLRRVGGRGVGPALLHL
mmetsp:Transcript_29072/g.68033  ORF Transcript_29072/g.68033 Transcript_29072/m.68033 type:complete len:202 (+) Transcript_29072:448-1053(+)